MFEEQKHMFTTNMHYTYNENIGMQYLEMSNIFKYLRIQYIFMRKLT